MDNDTTAPFLRLLLGWFPFDVNIEVTEVGLLGEFQRRTFSPGKAAGD